MKNFLLGLAAGYAGQKTGLFNKGAKALGLGAVRKGYLKKDAKNNKRDLNSIEAQLYIERNFPLNDFEREVAIYDFLSLYQFPTSKKVIHDYIKKL